MEGMSVGILVFHSLLNQNISKNQMQSLKTFYIRVDRAVC